MRCGVVIASSGRPIEVGQVVDAMRRQTFPPERIIVSLHALGDAPADLPSDVEVVVGAKGLPAQRNRGMLPILGEVDLIVFVDDDYLPSKRMLQGAVSLFAANPGIVGANGRLLADGINSPGIPFDKAVEMIAIHDQTGDDPITIKRDRAGLYGCNMVFRAAAIAEARFDERLPLYGWQEDIDFAAQLRSKGRLVLSDAFAGVHRGVKGGRSSGIKLGYSQIVNPIYLARKGTMEWTYARRIMRNNVVANAIRAFAPEPWVDRRGRLVGNFLGISDFCLRRDAPEKILEFS